jgi:hypothetical protein
MYQKSALGPDGQLHWKCSKGLYYDWEQMIDGDHGELKVNLLLNRGSWWTDIYSYAPYQIEASGICATAGKLGCPMVQL